MHPTKNYLKYVAMFCSFQWFEFGDSCVLHIVQHLCCIRRSNWKVLITFFVFESGVLKHILKSILIEQALLKSTKISKVSKRYSFMIATKLRILQFRWVTLDWIIFVLNWLNKIPKETFSHNARKFDFR